MHSEQLLVWCHCGPAFMHGRTVDPCGKRIYPFSMNKKESYFTGVSDRPKYKGGHIPVSRGGLTKETLTYQIWVALP